MLVCDFPKDLQEFQLQGNHATRKVLWDASNSFSLLSGIVQNNFIQGARQSQMKRKACDFEEEDSPQTRWSPFASTSSDWNGMITPPPESKGVDGMQHDQHMKSWRTREITHFNLRTRKRHRDGRPEENVIHQITLAKLFGAQRQEAFDREASPASPSPSLQTSQPHHQQQETNLPSWSTPEIRIEPPPVERNQRSIESFFQARPVSRDNQALSSNMLPMDYTQHLNSRSSTVASFQLTANQMCDDCTAPLRNDLGFRSYDDEKELSTAFACAMCQRCVCDTCAVRGDRRICLECAMPGGGRRQEDLTYFQHQDQSAMMLD